MSDIVCVHTPCNPGSVCGSGCVLGHVNSWHSSDSMLPPPRQAPGSSWPLGLALWVGVPARQWSARGTGTTSPPSPGRCWKFRTSEGGLRTSMLPTHSRSLSNWSLSQSATSSKGLPRSPRGQSPPPPSAAATPQGPGLSREAPKGPPCPPHNQAEQPGDTSHLPRGTQL